VKPGTRRQQAAGTEFSVQFGETTIKPEGHAKILGVILDSRLTFKQHIEEKYLAAVRTLRILPSYRTNTLRGGNINSLRELFQTLVLPIFTHAASVWHRPQPRTIPNQSVPQTRINKGKSTLGLTKYRQLQKEALRLISGAWRTVAAAALEVELFMLPADLALDQICANSIIRMASRPHTRKAVFQALQTTHPWSALYANAAQTQRDFRIPLMHTEKREAFVRMPWEPAPNLIIANTKEDALKNHEAYSKQHGTHVYSDGTGIDGEVAGAALLLETGASLARYLGPLQRTNSYFGEAVGLQLAIQLADGHHKQLQAVRPIYIYVDNRGLVQALEDPCAKTAQKHLREFLRILRQGRNPVTVIWVPGHVDIPGNEQVDNIAKRATGWRPEPEYPARPVNRPDQTAAIGSSKQRVREAILDIWRRRWRNNTTGRELYEICQEPNKRTLQAYKANTRALDTVIMRMRTANIGTAAVRFRYNHVDSPDCDQCDSETPQTLKHLLFTCPALTDLRQEYWPEGMARNLTELLTDQPVKAAKFMVHSRVIHEFKGVNLDVEEGLLRDLNVASPWEEAGMQSRPSQANLHP
jgi:ribonuclease HI